MMKYKESLAQSAEYLRLALPMMTKQAAAFHPVSYAVWYEYVAGMNKPLKSEIDDLTKDGKVLDEAAVAGLFQKHIAELDEETTQRVRAGFQSVLENMSRSAAEAGDQANQFGSALEQWSEGLGDSDNGGSSGDGVKKLLGNTRQMQGAISSLNQKLEDSQRRIEQLRVEVERAREDALADGLTGLTNRKGFDMALAACLSSSDSQQAGPSLLMTDIDHFKKVNDTYGHLFGDKVIRAVSQILKENVKGKDTAARYGGEEFVILLPDTSIEGARVVAEKIRTTIERSRIRRAENNEEIARITVSLGVASYRPGESATEFIERVDNALYASKHQGRNLVTMAPATGGAKPSKDDKPK
ncbi:GGDEF domain-containing protein [soil metagenome]